jgi:hypothetical protein
MWRLVVKFGEQHKNNQQSSGMSSATLKEKELEERRLADETKEQEEKEEKEENEEEDDVLHLGNLITITSSKYGVVTGRIIYRDIDLVRIVPQEASDRAIEFPMEPDGSAFSPALGVTSLEVIEQQTSSYYTDILGARPGEIVEFFTLDGQEAENDGVVEKIIKTPTQDAIQLQDGRVISFHGIGPQGAVKVIRVRTSEEEKKVIERKDTEQKEKEEGEEKEEEKEKEKEAGQERGAVVQTDILALLRGVLPAATVEVVPTAERTYPDSMQREDMFQDLLQEKTKSQQGNTRIVRSIEREVDILLSLKNKSIRRDTTGRILGPNEEVLVTMQDSIKHATHIIPSAIPVVRAARVLNVDILDPSLAYKETDVFPRSLTRTENESEVVASVYLESALPQEATGRLEEMRQRTGRGFHAYIYDLLSRDMQVLRSSHKAGTAEELTEWGEDQDILRTASLEEPVQGLSSGLPNAKNTEAPPLSLAFLLHNVTDRSIRVLPSDTHVQRKTGETHLRAPGDPSSIRAHVILPPKIALALRPPKNPGHLPVALLYSQWLGDERLPTITQTLRDLSSDSASPLHAWSLPVESAGSVQNAEWLTSVFPFLLHSADSLGPRTHSMLGLLDTMGLGTTDMAPPVANVIEQWVTQAQELWRSLLIKRRAEIQTTIDNEAARTFLSVVGNDSPLWGTDETSLLQTSLLAEFVKELQAQNPTLANATNLLTFSFMKEAQGDALPLVWSALGKMDGRPLSSLDDTSSLHALASSRMFAIRRKVLQSSMLRSLRAEPVVSTCPHARKLEAIRNIPDVVQRYQHLREFVETFQGGRKGNWMICALCEEPCVCYHELMELEAFAQPTRMDAIQKQILIGFGGDRYEGKIICKNCGQALQDIDYDEHVEFDDDGKPIASRSVLTEEQMQENADMGLFRTITRVAVTYATQSQRELGEALQTLLERGGILASPDTLRHIVRHADLFVNARAPSPAIYEGQRAKMMTAASTRIRTATGTGIATIDVPTYAAFIDNMRVGALASLVAIALQTEDPVMEVTNPFPLCPFSRDGWPLRKETKQEESGPANYIACVVASIQRDNAPWNHVSWAGEPKFETRKKKAFQITLTTLRILLDGDPKTGPLSITPEIRTALARAQADMDTLTKRALLSHTDKIPARYRPEPFPPSLQRPGIERNPIPAIQRATEKKELLAPLQTELVDAMYKQDLTLLRDLHRDAKEKGEGDFCCSARIPDVEEGVLRGIQLSGQESLDKAYTLLRNTLPTEVHTGSHLWSYFPVQHPPAIPQSIEEGVYFKLFLQYCYRGPRVGELHEFSIGNKCRQCNLLLGKPIDLIDFSKEGAAILSAQLGDLHIEITQNLFDALSEAIRRRRVLPPIRPVRRENWFLGLQRLAHVIQKNTAFSGISDALANIFLTLAKEAETQEEPVEKPSTEPKENGEKTKEKKEINIHAKELGRITLWNPLAEHMDTLRAEIADRIGPLVARQKQKSRAEEAIQAFAAFDTLTSEPFTESPRTLQEYWCAKTQAAGTGFAVTKVQGARWFKISKEHNEQLNKLVSENSLWYSGVLTEKMQIILRHVGETLGPVLRTWIQFVRPSSSSSSSWTSVEAKNLLQTIVLQVWRDAVTPTSWMYSTGVPSTAAEQETVASSIANWTRALMLHAKKQVLKYSRETIQQILQQRAELERTSVVEEFESIKDEDQRAAELLKKQFRIGRWAGGKNLQKYDPEMFEFENEQRKRMGLMDPPVESTGIAPIRQTFGFSEPAGRIEDGYDVSQAADGDNE